MKKYLRLFAKLLVCFVVVGLMSGAFLVKAEDNGGNNTGRPAFNSEMKDKREALRERIQTERKTFRETLQTNREVFRREVQAKKEEFRLANGERKAKFCQAARNMIGQRFEVAVRNLERLQDRVGEVIEKLNADGKDTALAEESLDLSKQKLDDAKTKIAEIKALVPENCESVTPEIFEQIKLLAREAKDLLKESRENLRQAIKEIKDLRGENEEDN